VQTELLLEVGFRIPIRNLLIMILKIKVSLIAIVTLFMVQMTRVTVNTLNEILFCIIIIIIIIKLEIIYEILFLFIHRNFF
jgi:hypothetical protein